MVSNWRTPTPTSGCTSALGVQAAPTVIMANAWVRGGTMDAVARARGLTSRPPSPAPRPA